MPDTERPLLAQHVKEAANAIARWKRGFVTGLGWFGMVWDGLGWFGMVGDIYIYIYNYIYIYMVCNMA